MIITFPFRLIGRLFKNIANWFKRQIANLQEFFKEEPEDTPLPDAFAKTMQDPSGIIEHFVALRKHLFRSVLVLVAAASLAFTFAQQILDILAQPAGGLEALIAIDVTEPLSVLMKISIMVGFAISLPYITFEIYLFIAPGLSRRNRINGLFAIPIIVLFFLGGMAFAYFMILPTAIPFLTSILGIKSQLRPSTYYNFATSIIFWLGVAFEFPIVIYILASMGILEPKTLKDQWRIAMVAIAVIAAAITPTVDPVNMSLIMAPLAVLYLLSIGLAGIASRSRAKRLASQG
jgi:sec-independent protein translocase protein TatC